MSLAQKLHAIQSLARRVAKRGVNPEQGWEYLQIEDAVLAAKRAMKRHKLILIGSLDQHGDGFNMTRIANDRGSGYVIDLVMQWTLKDLESDEKMTFYMPGSGWGYDKAVFKALTGSRKYAIIFIFNLAVGNDVEEERGPVSRSDAKERAQEIADAKLANVAAGKSIDADVPALFYQWFNESQTALVSGDKELMKRNADLVKEFKIGGKVVLSEAQLEVLKMRLEERGIPFRKLMA